MNSFIISFTTILKAIRWFPIFILNSNFIFQSVILFKNSISNHLKAQVILDRKPIQFSAPFIFSHSTMGTHGLIVLFPTKVASTQFHNIIFVHQTLFNFTNTPYYHWLGNLSIATDIFVDSKCCHVMSLHKSKMSLFNQKLLDVLAISNASI